MSDYTLADLTRITGAKRRAVQTWAEAKVIEAEAKTERAGRGTHRRFSRDEAIIACIVRSFAMRQMSIGELLNVSNAIRKQLKKGGVDRKVVDGVIAGTTLGYLILVTIAKRSWRCTILEAELSKVGGADQLFSNIGAVASEHAEKFGAMATVICLNTYLKELGDPF